MKNKDLLFFGVVIGCFVLLAILVYYLRSEAGQCLKNPYVYGARKMGNIECQCTQNNQDQPCPAKFMFNETTIKEFPDCSGGFKITVGGLNASLS